MNSKLNNSRNLLNFQINFVSPMTEITAEIKTYTTYYQSPIGVLEIIGTENEINSVLFVDSEINAENKINLPEILNNCIQQLDEYFTGKRKEFSINTTQTGTDFQQSIWKELHTIPFGKTVSYLDIAKKINNEKSIRAVGNANSKNKISIIIPCHRVIGKNRNLVGYSGELWRKKWLLEHEAKFAFGVQQLF
jgi:methylated-DNA-[protein]-cysteine S-methyltransferase